MSDEWMPGAWICDKCGFQLQKNVLSVSDGAIAANKSPLNNTCPNDGTLMRPLTWREVNKSLFDTAVAERKRADALSKVLHDAIFFLEHSLATRNNPGAARIVGDGKRVLGYG